MVAFTQEIVGKYIIRIVYRNCPKYLFNWHTDEYDRIVKVLDCCDGWYFQYDNELPFKINKGDVIEIPNYLPHRIIREYSKKDLILKILDIK
ncbi:hypothetical protein BPT24_010 [Tenacibaculum phage pT24]|uniref:Cupin n=1 Tax=Tenacibaculum phage pT24 TaxID=1880590 RepID=A0A1B4XWE7_9CAUD|nr:hypothetical protein HYP10_gp010 [Tenacibaculum phage pT24]BAV39132.1 hypothetical protein BPT24_010 [Tenacibaculum phage pT24]